MANITRSALDALSSTNFPDNTSQLISPADLRGWLESGVDSFLTQKDTNTLENALYEAQGSALAASASVNLSTATGNYLHITGAATINSFGTCSAGSRFILVFDGVCTLTDSATLILPGGSDITTAAGDCAMLVSEGSGNWKMVGFFPIAGGGGGGDITAVTAGTGLSGGGTSGAVTLNLSNTAVTPNSYTNANITVDAQGRITSASNGSPGGVTSVSVTSPITDSGTPTAPNIGIQNADADGTTKGAATFTASDFNATSGVISIDYANGQKASASQDGFLSSGNWTTFNNKVSTGAVTGSGLTMATSRLLGRTTASTGAIEEISLTTTGTSGAATLSGGVLNIPQYSGGGTPGGSSTELQFNNSGSFGGVPNATWDGTNLTLNTPRFGQSLGNGHFSFHRSNSVPAGATDYLTLFWNQTNKDLGFTFETDGFESYFRFAATTSDKIYTFPDLSGTIALLANPASFSSLTSTSSVTIGTAGPTGTTGTIVLQNATNANTLTLQSGTTSTSYTITMPPAASVGAQYLQTTGTGGTLQWASGTTTGVSTVGTFSASAQTNGATISGSVITFGPASDTVPGMVSTGTQTFGGAKTFSGTASFFASAASAASVAITTSSGSTTNPQLSIGSSGGTSIQWMSFGTGVTNAPTLISVGRSTGTKIVLSAQTGANLDTALGVEGGGMWLSSGGFLRMYASNSTTQAGQFEYSTSVRGLNLSAASDGTNSMAQLLITSGSPSNMSAISFGANTSTGSGAPVSGTTRSSGTKLILSANAVASGIDTAIGFNSARGMWLCSGGTIDFYAGAPAGTLRATIDANGLTLAANCSVVMATTGTGGMIGTSTTQLVGFHGVAGTTQRAAAAQAAVAATAATQTTPWGYSTAAQADGVITLLNEIRTVLVNKGLMKGSA